MFTGVSCRNSIATPFFAVPRGHDYAAIMPRFGGPAAFGPSTFHFIYTIVPTLYSPRQSSIGAFSGNVAHAEGQQFPQYANGVAHHVEM